MNTPDSMIGSASEALEHSHWGSPRSPMLFPFVTIPLNIAELEGHERLEWFRQGLEEEIVMRSNL
jgi:hypothetical protein